MILGYILVCPAYTNIYKVGATNYHTADLLNHEGIVTAHGDSGIWPF